MVCFEGLHVSGVHCFLCLILGAESGLFADSSGVELAIVAVCAFAAALVVAALLFVCICYCVFKRSRHSEKSSSGYSSPYELKSSSASS